MATRADLENQALGYLGGGNLNIPLYPYQDVFQGYEDLLTQQNADLANMSNEAWGWTSKNFQNPVASPFKVAVAQSDILAAAESELKKKQDKEAMLYDLAESIARKSPQGRFGGGKVNFASPPNLGTSLGKGLEEYKKGLETPPADMSALEDMARAAGIIKEDPNNKWSDFERQQKALKDLGASPEELKEHAFQGHRGTMTPREAMYALDAIAKYNLKKQDDDSLPAHPLEGMQETLKAIASGDKNVKSELSEKDKLTDHYKKMVGKEAVAPNGVRVKIVGVDGDKFRVVTKAGRQGLFSAKELKLTTT